MRSFLIGVIKVGSFLAGVIFGAVIGSELFLAL